MALFIYLNPLLKPVSYLFKKQMAVFAYISIIIALITL